MRFRLHGGPRHGDHVDELPEGYRESADDGSATYDGSEPFENEPRPDPESVFPVTGVWEGDIPGPI